MDATDYQRSLSMGALLLARRLLMALASIGVLTALMALYEVPLTEPYKALMIVAALLGLIISGRKADAASQPRRPVAQLAARVGVDSLIFAGVVLITGYIANAAMHYDGNLLFAWLLAMPVALLGSHLALEWFESRVASSGQQSRRTVLVGGNQLSARFLKHISIHPDQSGHIEALFDDRSPDRFPDIDPKLHRGGLSDLARYVQDRQIDSIIVALPMANQNRVQKAVRALGDTTASVYFLPDVFSYDLIQCRTSSIGGMPIVALCETPLYGLRAIAKRASDVVIAAGALLVLSPLLLAIAGAVKASSPGPVIFRQRRFGLDGQEIVVYKFRTMTCTEDGAQVTQASRDDDRITPIGARLRKYSLDELPQFFNVLQGHMSVVGPRPHAVSHNEYYRKLIDGYMIRHKVPPGITGLAQVSGMRGETATVEEMRNRIEFDLAYLRNWSIGLDMQIICRTVALMFRDDAAY